MIKTLVATVLAFFAAAAFAAVDINKASQPELEAIKGIGPTMSGRMLEERQKSPFTDWNDLRSRVKGVGQANAAKFSTAGLTVNGAAYTGAAEPAKPAKAAKASVEKEPKQAKPSKAREAAAK
jgi:competence protein ComEA